MDYATLRFEDALDTDQDLAFRAASSGEFRPAYGSGTFQELLVSEKHGESLDLCRTHKGDACWVLRTTYGRNGFTSVVRVLFGDREKIRSLVEAEITHFDTKVTWEN